ncbi:MAG: tRNA (guanosine(37)-N1)-methyltransferase TrmD [Syntrophales bacterium]|nr:tRNA (guanosine(37)-N1)-methyltransferase TrmD [Syntrophales bacterium]HOG07330.1 tRNA (guanosine(37)-N1)-methyltransferase TrmD [Syntrophales bacterium]HOS77406.1 tRNA (guanosine(37)-N1)-methyltransferase TrmD [Syntrophales bacterium]HQN26612.1 tRNA (guanosine(37)-N1)-methyltransferase TrmD [Syntrophales bacterium]
MIRFDILSVFPGMFASPLAESLIGKARDKGLVDIRFHDIRDYATDRHRMTDDAPYGGGGGMVMKVEPIDRALEAILPDRSEGLVILMTPQGEPFSQRRAEELASHPRLVLLCGHYEGVDERVREHLVDRELSIGDYVLTGGELAAMVVVDAVSRLIPGVLGNDASAAEDSFSTGILEYPHYTRPATYRGWPVPEVLLSGNHAEIEAWRRTEALKRTLARRPDLLEKKVD